MNSISSVYYVVSWLHHDTFAIVAKYLVIVANYLDVQSNEDELITKHMRGSFVYLCRVLELAFSNSTCLT